ncbi:MAG: oligopeptide/dipeptide ABC transporter ATP-binding protein [Rectinemataceae bacterium]
MSGMILEGKDLRKLFPVKKGVFMKTVAWVRALERFDFRIGEGGTLGIVGESGCGKTTLGRVMARIHEGEGSLIYHPREGEPYDVIGSLDRTRELAFRRDVQMIFQDPYASLDPRMTVAEVLREPLEAHGLSGASAAERRSTEAMLANQLERVGLHADALARYPHEFSGGQRQRIAIARSLVLKPRLVICDEPTSALDVSVQSQVVNLLTGIQREEGLAYVFISHNLELVRHVSDHICVMYLGRVVEEGGAEAVFDAPLHPYTMALLASAPSWDPKEKHLLDSKLYGEPPSPLRLPPGCPFEPRCPKASAVCKNESPELKGFGEGRKVACHFA